MSETESIWSAEYWAQKGAVKLWMWRKRAGAPPLSRRDLPNPSNRRRPA